MPNTTFYGWPWPAGTDRVMDGDNAMGSLAQAIEATLRAHPIAQAIALPSATFAVPQGAPVLVTGCTTSWTSTQAELTVVAFVADVAIATVDPGPISVQLAIDGAGIRTSFVQTNATNTGRGPAVMLHVATLAAGNHSAEMRAGKGSAGGVANIGTASPLLVLRFPR